MARPEQRRPGCCLKASIRYGKLLTRLTGPRKARKMATMEAFCDWRDPSNGGRAVALGAQTWSRAALALRLSLPHRHLVNSVDSHRAGPSGASIQAPRGPDRCDRPIRRSLHSTFGVVQGSTIAGPSFSIRQAFTRLSNRPVHWPRAAPQMRALRFLRLALLLSKGFLPKDCPWRNFPLDMQYAFRVHWHILRFRVRYIRPSLVGRWHGRMSGLLISAPPVEGPTQDGENRGRLRRVLHSTKGRQ
jgi:hypothetical protein